MMGSTSEARGLKDNGGRGTVRENTLLKCFEPSQGALEAEAVAGLGLLVQATNLMATSTTEVDANTPDQIPLLLDYSGSVSLGRTLRPCLLP